MSDLYSCRYCKGLHKQGETCRFTPDSGQEAYEEIEIQKRTITRLTAELAEAHEFINSKFDPVFALNVKMADELAASRAEFIGAMTSLGSMADELTTARADAAVLREALHDLVEADWMVSHDWGGDRDGVMKRARQALAASKGETK